MKTFLSLGALFIFIGVSGVVLGTSSRDIGPREYESLSPDFPEQASPLKVQIQVHPTWKGLGVFPGCDD